MDGGRKDLFVTGGIMAAGFAAVWMLWPQSDPRGLPAEARCGDRGFVSERYASLEECLRKEGAVDILEEVASPKGAAAPDTGSAPKP